MRYKPAKAFVYTTTFLIENAMFLPFVYTETMQNEYIHKMHFKVNIVNITAFDIDVPMTRGKYLVCPWIVKVYTDTLTSLTVSIYP